MLRSLLSRVISFANALTQRHLTWIHRLTTTRPLAVLSACGLAMLLSIVVITTTRFDSDIFQLFPTRQPALKLLLDSLQWTGSAKEAYFLLEGDRDTLPREAERLAGRLRASQVDGEPAFRRVTWRVYDENEARAFTEFIAFAAARPQLFVEVSDVPALVQRYAPDKVTASLQRLRADLAAQFGGVMSGMAPADPLYLRDLILPRIKAASQALDLDPSSPYFLSRDGKVLIMIAEPARPVQDMVFARKLVAVINEARTGAAVSISCAGAHISAVLDEQAMKGNILSCILSSLVVVLAIFYATYRRILPTLLVPLILVCGVVLAMGTARLLLPSIHIISFAFMALIIGLGTDYSIHLYDRFHTERVAGLETEEALRLALLDTGHGVFTAAGTTALPFLALYASDVRALSELGLLVGLGVIFSLYATFFFLPPLLIYMERRFPVGYRPIPTLGLGWVWRLALRWPGSVVVVSLMVAIIFGGAALRVTFDGELKNLQPRHSEAFLAQEKIERHLSLSPKQMLVAVEGKELNDVLVRAARVDKLAARLQERGEIAAWSSLGRVVNAPDRQAEVVRLVRQQLGGHSPAQPLRNALERAGFALEPFRPFLTAADQVVNALPIPEEEALAGLKASPLRGVVDRHLIHNADGYHALIYLHYAAGFRQSAFLAELAAIDPTARASSVDLVSSQLAGTVKNAFLWGFVLGGVLVLFLLLIHFESLAGIFYTLFPVMAGSLAMLGAMALSGMGLNFMNAMVLVTIVGMGSDYGLHMHHRISANDPGERGERFIQSGRAVLLSALTTIAGFGSLALADYPALASIGWATNLGIGFTALFALVTLPAIAVASAHLFRAGRREQES